MQGRIEVDTPSQVLDKPRCDRSEFRDVMGQKHNATGVEKIQNGERDVVSLADEFSQSGKSFRIKALRVIGRLVVGIPTIGPTIDI